jgi:hypothetical protein
MGIGKHLEVGIGTREMFTQEQAAIYNLFFRNCSRNNQTSKTTLQNNGFFSFEYGKVRIRNLFVYIFEIKSKTENSNLISYFLTG